MARKRRRALDATVQLKVRLPEPLRRWLEREAARNQRSMNSEIVDRLLRSSQVDDDKTTLIAKAIIDTYPGIADRIEEIFEEARRDDYLANDLADEERIERAMAAERAERERNDE
jgi:Arc-like DNA binding domain